MKIFFILIFFTLVLVGLISYNVTHAFFSSTAHSTNNVFAAISVFPTPTPIPVNPGDVVINEINWAGNNNHPNDEWIELRNRTTHPIDLTNWVIDNLGSGGGSNIAINKAATISALGFFLIANFPKESANTVLNVDPDFQTAAISLLDTGEQLRLRTNTSLLVDAANATGSAWFAGSNSIPKKSMERNTPVASGLLSTSWHTASTSVNLKNGATESATPRVAND